MNTHRVLAATLTVATLAGGVIANPASANAAATELSSGSSSGSSKPDYYDPAPSRPGQPAVPEKRAFESSYTGSAPISIALAVLASAVVLQLIVDFTPPIRKAVDDVAAQLGMAGALGSSEGNRIFPAEQITAMINDALNQAMR